MEYEGHNGNLSKQRNSTVKKTNISTASSCSSVGGEVDVAFSIDCDSSEVEINACVNTEPIPRTETAVLKSQSSISTYVRRRSCVDISRQKKIDRLVVNMVVQDLQPFSIVEDTGFRELMLELEPGYKLINRKYLTQHYLPDLYAKTKVTAKDLIQRETQFVSLTTDGWTSSANESYIAITAHYVNNCWELKSILLECCHLELNHTAENLCHVLLKCIKDWNIEKKVYAVSTDNAANIVAAIRLTGWAHIPCFAHTINLVVQAR